jgi:polyhydroxyalkanoate synthesis regulator phasin
LFEYLLEKATTVKEVFDLTLMRMEYLEGRVVELEQQVKQLEMELIRK